MGLVCLPAAFNISVLSMSLYHLCHWDYSCDCLSILRHSNPRLITPSQHCATALCYSCHCPFIHQHPNPFLITPSWHFTILVTTQSFTNTLVRPTINCQPFSPPSSFSFLPSLCVFIIFRHHHSVFVVFCSVIMVFWCCYAHVTIHTYIYQIHGG